MKKIVLVPKKVEEVADIVCDNCGKSCRTDYGFEFMQLSASWGFMSGKDLEKWEAQICEECVDKHLGFIKFKKEDSITGRKI